MSGRLRDRATVVVTRRECLPKHSHVEAMLERLCGLPTPIRDGAEQ